MGQRDGRGHSIPVLNTDLHKSILGACPQRATCTYPKGFMPFGFFYANCPICDDPFMSMQSLDNHVQEADSFLVP
jgi:hypothetical protein